MHCTTCGTAILPGMLHCPNCGTPTTSNTSPVNSPGAAPEQTLPAMSFGPFMESASIPSPAQPGSPAPLPPEMYLPGNQQAMQAPSFYATGTEPGTQYARAGTPPYGSNAYTVGQGQYASPPSYPPPGQPLTPQAPKRAGGLSRGLRIVLIVLILLILIGSGIIYYFSVPYPAQVHASATATAQTLANNQATGTAQVIHNANATATAQVQATVTAQQNIYNAATNGTPAVTDGLTQNDGLRWDQYDTSNSGGCVYSGSAYHVKELQSGYFQTCMAQASNYSNFTIQVQMTIVRGDYGGIVFRSSASSPKFYLLQFSVDGIYNLLGYVSTNGNDARSLLSSVTPAIKGLNQPNLITLIARGSQLTVFVNKQYVDTVSDDLYKSGQIGFMAYYKSNQTEVAYSNMQIWQL